VIRSETRLYPRRPARKRPAVSRFGVAWASMTLTEHPGDPGLPWARPLHGSLDRLLVRSDRLRSNPLGDPETRPLYVYCPPGVRERDTSVPSVYWLQGFLGQVDMLSARLAFEPTFIERLDELFARGGG